ncbi:MAG: hypothetical protein PG977_000123 [Bartonella clarridgeiae]|uniref:autotransporter outer membrane beta-barrel domain-containing protein n=1 Tax=Bartonella clarridgeiae TaxID=56426 RepID=UPI0023F29BB5|nr:autotransporter outer membrane beta-barrel domain-containing protein [Bartonella clarridgeiae]WCR54730.1 MAG: hypothetical protein PG977_000123 [Bartonella clarridgeiae]
MLQVFSSFLFFSLLFSSLFIADTVYPKTKVPRKIESDDRAFVAKIYRDDGNIKVRTIKNITCSIPNKSEAFCCKSDQKNCNSSKKKKEKNNSKNNNEELAALNEGVVAIYASKLGTVIDVDDMKIFGPVQKSEQPKGTEHIYGVWVKQQGAVTVGEATLKDLTVGLNAEADSIIYITSGSIKDSEVAVYSHGNRAYIGLEDVSITVGDKGVGLLNKENASIIMMGDENKGDITFTAGNAVYIDTGEVILENITIRNNVKGSDTVNRQHAIFSSTVQTAIHIHPDSVFKMEEGNVTLEYAHGLVFDVGGSREEKKASGPIEVDIDSANIQVNSAQFYGMYLHYSDKKSQSSNGKSPENHISNGNNRKSLENHNSIVVSLKKTNFSVPKSAVIYSDKSDNTHNLTFKLSENATLSGNLLLQANSGVVKVEADGSKLEGGSLITNGAIANLHLKNHSTWTLTKRKQQPSKDLSVTDSSISTMILSDSSIIFEKPTSNIYQTLRIGKGSGTVYTAQGNAELYINTYLNQGGEIARQKTDRLLIHGDVSGTTTVHVLAVSGSPGDEIGRGAKNNNKGISIIQVSGAAQEDSFKLFNDYITLYNLPYQYRLYAYGPSSALGAADPKQKLVGNNEERENRDSKSSKPFWDYRLQIEYISFLPFLKPMSLDLASFKPRRFQKPGLPEKRVPVVVPQLPSYLVLPHALFHANLVDINNHYELLESTHNGTNETGHNGKANFFIHGYGSNYRYASNLTVFEYGYSADLDYNAMMAGVVLKTLESKHSALSLGAIGTYSSLSLQPYVVEQSQKSIFNKWSGKLYAHLQYDTGFYVNGVMSCGSFKGDVSTLVRGKTATLRGELLSSSLMGGQAILTNYDGFVVEPQLQVIYQSVMFDKARDIDRFDIDLGNHNQWIASIGGRFTKTMMGSEEGRIVSFYSKFHFAHNYENKRIVHFKDAFQLGAFGSTVEAGLGVHAQLLSKIVLHGDLLYKHKLTKAGFSGTSVSGGIRYQF